MAIVLFPGKLRESVGSFTPGNWAFFWAPVAPTGGLITPEFGHTSLDVVRDLIAAGAGVPVDNFIANFGNSTFYIRSTPALLPKSAELLARCLPRVAQIDVITDHLCQEELSVWTGKGLDMEEVWSIEQVAKAILKECCGRLILNCSEGDGDVSANFTFLVSSPLG